MTTLAAEDDKPRKPGVRIMPDGRRIDLKAKRAKRKKAFRDDDVLGVDPRAAHEIAKSYHVGQIGKRMQLRQAATQREREELNKVKEPRRQARKEAAVRTQTGKESATPERTVRAGDDQRIGDDGAQRLTDAPLDSLRARNVITLRQFEAGDRFREDWYNSGLMPTSSRDLERIGSGFGTRAPAFLASERRAAAADRYKAAEQALGPQLSAIVNACVHASAGVTVVELGQRLFGRRNANEARAAFVETLKIGLDRLDAHYAPPPRTRIVGTGERVGICEELWEKKHA